MLPQNPSQIRRTMISAAMVLALSLPSVATAGVLDRARTGVQNAKPNAGKVVSIVRKKRPVATALKNAGQNMPGAELFEMVQQLELKEQLRGTIELIQQMQADYRSFSGGVTGCAAECKVFRNELKDLFTDFLFLVEDVPVLQKRAHLIDNLERLSSLIDYVPPRALYLMWQATGDQLAQLRMTAETIRQTLNTLPPFIEVSDVLAAVKGAGTTVTNSAVCAWVSKADKPVVEWIQAELEGLAWGFKTIGGFIPDITVKGEAGASAGAAVANGTASAGAGVKITDPIKIALKVAATVPEAINQAIKVNTARAKLVCAGAAFVGN